MKLRQVALESAREMWADYFMVSQIITLYKHIRKNNYTENFSILNNEPMLQPRESLLVNNSSRRVNTGSHAEHHDSCSLSTKKGVEN